MMVSTLKNHSILNLREFFHSEKYTFFTQHAAVAILVRSTNSKCCNPVDKFEEKLAYTIFH